MAGEAPLHTLQEEKQYLIRTELEEHTIKHSVTIALAQLKPQFNKEPLKKANIDPNLTQRSHTLHRCSGQGTRSRLEHSQHQQRGHGDAPTRALHPLARGAQPQWPRDTGPVETGNHDQTHAQKGARAAAAFKQRPELSAGL